MELTIHPGKLSGTVTAIPSKSMTHRNLICAAFADKPTELICPETNQDIEATATCLSLICHYIARTGWGYDITPYGYDDTPFDSVYMNCHESGSTLRFLLPIVGALGIYTIFKMEGRLPQRPLSPLWEEMERMGCRLKWISEDELEVSGKLRAGEYFIDGSVSSQFISGLLFATSLLDGDSKIHILGTLESAPYVTMTQNVMALFGVDTKDFFIRGGQHYHSPGIITVEGDWSNGAFWLAAQQLGNKLDVLNLDPQSPQGDRAAASLLAQLQENIVIDATHIPDLVPILAIVAGANQGAVFTNIQRLRLKESDRVASTIAMIEALGGKASDMGDYLTVWGTGYRGGIVDSCNDHRIAMAAAIAATVCTHPVTIRGSEAVRKSYPGFWEEYRRLGGNYEQHLR